MYFLFWGSCKKIIVVVFCSADILQVQGFLQLPKESRCTPKHPIEAHWTPAPNMAEKAYKKKSTVHNQEEDQSSKIENTMKMIAIYLYFSSLFPYIV